MIAASEALAQSAYHRCESLCLQALTEAREQGDWANYARILMPLQESRRLKRQTALDHAILLGTASCGSNLLDDLDHPEAGCIVVTHPHSTADVSDLIDTINASGKAIEVLWADSDTQDKSWRVSSVSAPAFGVELSAPERGWVNRWVHGSTPDGASAAHWFMQANEALGNTGLSNIQAELGTEDRIIQLEAVLQAAGDHELLHQALGDAVRAFAAKG